MAVGREEEDVIFRATTPGFLRLMSLLWPLAFTRVESQKVSLNIFLFKNLT